MSELMKLFKLIYYTWENLDVNRQAEFIDKMRHEVFVYLNLDK